MISRNLKRLLRTPGRLTRHLLPRRLRRMLVIPLVIVGIGTVAYPLIEGEKWSLFDGLYMTVITLTTLGYGEIPEPLSKPGRVFTMCLALGGIFILFYIATDAIRSVVTGELRDLLGKERMDDRLKHLRDHMIVCGFGRMGKIVCDELEKLHHPFVVIDTDTPKTEWPYAHGLRLYGNATEDDLLRRAGIDRAKALMAVVGSDAENLYITLSARLLNPKLMLVARAEEEEAEAKLRKVGVNKVISPYLTGGHRAVQAVLKPSVLHFMESATKSEYTGLQVEELRIEPGSKLARTTIESSRLVQDYNVTVVGVLQSNGELLSSPTGDTVIEPGAVLIAIGTRPNLERIEPLALSPKRLAGTSPG